ncbi:hypothetical protein INR49_008691 [Caranx melampygus]|nr:hypothetical protein INR49_008691 [Caranx melampygus]
MKHPTETRAVEEADQIYLLMKEEYRISRNVRLAWFLGKLNQVIWPASVPELDDQNGEMIFDEVFHALTSRWSQSKTQVSIATNWMTSPTGNGGVSMVSAEWVWSAWSARASWLQLLPPNSSAVGGAYSYDCSFGYIPNVELMKFISLATFGSYLPSCPEVDLNSQR